MAGGSLSSRGDAPGATASTHTHGRGAGAVGAAPVPKGRRRQVPPAATVGKVHRGLLLLRGQPGRGSRRCPALPSATCSARSRRSPPSLWAAGPPLRELRDPGTARSCRRGHRTGDRGAADSPSPSGRGGRGVRATVRYCMVQRTSSSTTCWGSASALTPGEPHPFHGRRPISRTRRIVFHPRWISDRGWGAVGFNRPRSADPLR